jgi:hypothetical protein
MAGALATAAGAGESGPSAARATEIVETKLKTDKAMRGKRSMSEK